MDATTETDIGGRPILVEGLLGRLLRRPTHPQPVGEDVEQWMKVTALQTDGIDIHFTKYRPSDITGQRPIWYEFVYNLGDIDLPPIGIPMGPRHFGITARPREG